MFFWQMEVLYYNEEAINFEWKHISPDPETNPLYSLISYGILKHKYTVHLTFHRGAKTQTCDCLATVTNS